jgi:hypothetical protein
LKGLLTLVAEEELGCGRWAMSECETAADYAVAAEGVMETRLKGVDLCEGRGGEKDGCNGENSRCLRAV